MILFSIEFSENETVFQNKDASKHNHKHANRATKYNLHDATLPQTQTAKELWTIGIMQAIDAYEAVFQVNT